jgi:hypothetical protein
LQPGLPMRLIATASMLGCLLALAGTARAQTGGSSGSMGLQPADILITVQRQQGVNLPEREIAQLFNRANCQCQEPMWLKAIITPSATARAATIPSTASVQMYLGTSCSSSSERPYCPIVGSPLSFSDFRISGLNVMTNVERLSHVYSRSTGSTNALPEPNINDCTSGSTFDQTVWVLISTTSGDGDVVAAPFKVTINRGGPPKPENLDVAAAHEALIVSWTPVSANTYSNLLGYQILCTRADEHQVFKEGTFTPAFDSCPSVAGSGTPVQQIDNRFVCSGLLSASASSARLKILENGISYGVGVVAVDNRRNASATDLDYETPVVTRDFYSEYRRGDPEGGAHGGFCAVARGDGAEQARAGLALAAGLLAVAAYARRRRRPR